MTKRICTAFGLAFALLAVAGLVSPARAVTFDLDFTGIVGSSSIDALGLFGTAGNSLTGDTFTANFFYTVPGATYTIQNPYEVTVQPITYSLTINNQTVTPASFGPITSGQIQASTPQACCGISAYVNTQTGATDAPGTVDTGLGLDLMSAILFPNGTHPNLLSPFAYARQTGDTQGSSQFSIYGWNSTSDFLEENVNFNIDSVSLSPVPLPPALPLFGCAVLGLGAFAWWGKRSKLDL